LLDGLKIEKGTPDGNIYSEKVNLEKTPLPITLNLNVVEKNKQQIVLVNKQHSRSRRMAGNPQQSELIKSDKILMSSFEFLYLSIISQINNLKKNNVMS
jgi:hypothetical protein